MTPPNPTFNPQLLMQALAAIVTEAIAFGILSPSTAQTIIALGGIVLPAAFAIAQALHLGRVHAAQVTAAAVAPVAPVALKPAKTPAKPAA